MISGARLPVRCGNGSDGGSALCRCVSNCRATLSSRSSTWARVASTWCGRASTLSPTRTSFTLVRDERWRERVGVTFVWRARTAPGWDVVSGFYRIAPSVDKCNVTSGICTPFTGTLPTYVDGLGTVRTFPMVETNVGVLRDDVRLRFLFVRDHKNPTIRRHSSPSSRPGRHCGDGAGVVDRQRQLALHGRDTLSHGGEQRLARRRIQGPAAAHGLPRPDRTQRNGAHSTKGRSVLGVAKPGGFLRVSTMAVVAGTRRTRTAHTRQSTCKQNASVGLVVDSNAARRIQAFDGVPVASLEAVGLSQARAALVSAPS